MESIVAKVLQAYGGAPKLREVYEKPFRSKGKITEVSSISQAQNTFECLMATKANKLRMEMTIMGQPLITAFDGKQGWLQQGDQVFPADPMTMQRVEGEIRHSLEHELLDLAAPSAKVKLGNDEELNGKVCFVLSLDAGDTQPIRLFVDKETYLVARSEFQGVDLRTGNRRYSSERLPRLPPACRIYGALQSSRVHQRAKNH